MDRLSLFAALTLLAFSTAAGAAVLGVSTDQSTYEVGEKIWLDVVADSEGEAISNAFVQVTYEPALAENGPESDRTRPGSPWLHESLSIYDRDGYLTVLNEVSLSPTSGVWSVTASLIAEAPGEVHLGFGASPDIAPVFSFGSAVPGPSGTSFTIVPEPGTAGLLGLGLGLLRLAGARRRRRP